MNSDRKEQLRIVFDTVAATYDHPSLRFFQDSAVHLVDRLALPPPLHWLDVATGTGAVALEAAARIPDARVVGIDLSSGMLEQARRKAAMRSLRNVSFRCLDLEKAPELARERFDVATCGFGLFFFDDMGGALRRIVQAVRPGGRVAITSFTSGAFSPFVHEFLALYESYGRTAPPLSWKSLGSASALHAVYGAAGITNVTVYHDGLGHNLGSSREWWDVLWNAGFRGLLDQLSANELEEFKHRHLNTVQSMLNQRGRWLNTGVLCAVGTVE